MNSKIHKNHNYKISDDELNKVRAYVTHSQQPLPSMRLLKKEKEERNVDISYKEQKEMIIHDAKEIEMKRLEYKEEIDLI